MKPILPVVLTLSVIALGACTSTSNPIGNNSSTPSVSSVGMQETKNVTYQGVLQTAGASIFMEGTHKLQLEDGRFIMLESTDVNLGEYVGQKVELFGAVRPTTEAGGMIMRVERIASREPSSASSAVSSEAGRAAFTGATVTYIGAVRNDPSGTCSLQIRGKNTGVFIFIDDCAKYDGKIIEATGKLGSIDGGTDNAMEVSVFKEILPVSSAMSSALPKSSIAAIVFSSSSSSAAPVVTSSAAPAPATSSVAYDASSELTAKAALMAKDNTTASFWTQKYCSPTAAYCVAVHKNWYFTSFGATSSTLWYLEIGPQEINNIGEGPLTVNLVSGTAASAGGADGQVLSKNGGVIGYKEWTNGRHFEIRGPSNLQAAIAYMIGTINPYSAQ